MNMAWARVEREFTMMFIYTFAMAMEGRCGPPATGPFDFDLRGLCGKEIIRCIPRSPSQAPARFVLLEQATLSGARCLRY
jgi:hypothetical protein